MSNNVLALVMAGGMGERLRPLTDVRAKPGVPFGGIYRIIDFTLSNCINSDVRKILVLTQYKSHSLSNHIKSGWSFLSRRLDQFIDELPAQMQTGSGWYKGTADAIRQNMLLIEQLAPRRILILSGDHIYKMDYRLMERFHQEREAGLTISVIRVPVDEARGAFGVIEVDERGQVIGFEEKPTNPKTIPGTRECYASMGIYLFEYPWLCDSLRNSHDDFGKHIIPMLLAEGRKVYAFDYNCLNKIEEYEYRVEGGRRMCQLSDRASDSTYWRDVGTLDSYWLANLDLVNAQPKFNLYGERWPIFTSPQHFPPAKFVHEEQGRTGAAINSVVADGVIISGATVRNSIAGPGLYLHSYSTVDSCVLMGGELRGGIMSATSISRNCRLRNAIVDKNVNLSEGISIGYDRAEDERRGLKIQPIAGTDGYVVVVPKDFVL